MKKVIIIFLVLTLFIPLAACNEQSDQNDKLDINISDDDISTVEPLEGTSTDAKLQFDETGGSSYITYNVSGDVEPYIENNMEFPDNMFIYKITNPTSENAAIYGYINENFDIYVLSTNTRLLRSQVSPGFRGYFRRSGPFYRPRQAGSLWIIKRQGPGQRLNRSGPGGR